MLEISSDFPSACSRHVCHDLRADGVKSVGTRDPSEPSGAKLSHPLAVSASWCLLAVVSKKKGLPISQV